MEKKSAFIKGVRDCPPEASSFPGTVGLTGRD